VIRVALVEDQTLVRQGIRSLLELAGDIEMAGEAGDGDEGLELIARERPDVVLLDLRMPERDGLSVLAELQSRGDPVPVLVLTTFDDDELVLTALRSGARGFLLKDVTLEQLVGAVRTLAAGGSLLQPALTDRLLRAVTTPAGRPPGDPDGFGDLPAPQPLTERELEILRLLAGGYANREIADALHLAPGTVKNHVSNVLLKLGAGTAPGRCSGRSTSGSSDRRPRRDHAGSTSLPSRGTGTGPFATPIEHLDGIEVLPSEVMRRVARSVHLQDSE
jgi:DNA-binding NarL/FixJ family response regulator